MNDKQKHLEFIQGVINRLATASFRLKGWAAVLVTALFVLMREELGGLALIALVPVLIFWGLDGYFLWQERLFRALYDHVRVLQEGSVDFSMNVSAFRNGWKQTWRGAILSITLIMFYGALVVAIAVVLLFNLVGETK